MRGFLRNRSRRWGIDGWAVMVRGANKPLDYTVSTTRDEARRVRAEMLDLGMPLDVVKVKITVEAIE